LGESESNRLLIMPQNNKDLKAVWQNEAVYTFYYSNSTAHCKICVRPMCNCVVIERRLCTGRTRLVTVRSLRLSRIWRGGGEMVGRSITGHHSSRACQRLRISQTILPTHVKHG
jgi:hypothetical protein